MGLDSLADLEDVDVECICALYPAISAHAAASASGSFFFFISTFCTWSAGAPFSTGTLALSIWIWCQRKQVPAG